MSAYETVSTYHILLCNAIFTNSEKHVALVKVKDDQKGIWIMRLQQGIAEVRIFSDKIADEEDKMSQ